MRVLVGLVAICALASSAFQAAPSPPQDFALRFAYGLCTTDVLDTFHGTYTRDLGPREAPVTIPITLPGQMTHEIFTAIEFARFGEYPEVFFVPSNSGFAPAMHYRLEIRTGGMTHAVTWTDGTRPSTPEADRLRNLFTKLTALIRTCPEVAKLPQAKVGCA